MGRINTISYLPQKMDGTADGQGPFATQKPVKRLALDVFHHKIENTVGGFAKVGDTDRIRMLDRCGSLCFAFETCDSLAFLKIVAA